MGRKEKHVTGSLNLFEVGSYTLLSIWYGTNQCLSLLKWGMGTCWGKEKDRRIWTILLGSCCNFWGWHWAGQRVGLYIFGSLPTLAYSVTEIYKLILS